MNCVVPHFTEEEINLLKQSGRVLTVKAGHILFRENDETDHVYLIESGHVKHYHTTSLGKVVIVSICGPSEMIGVPAVLLGQRRGVFAEALEPGTLWRIEQEVFLRLLHQYPQLAVKLAAIHCQLVRNYEYGLQTLVVASADSRLAWLLLRLAEGRRPEWDGGQRVSFYLTHQEMADMIGSCRQTVTTVLGNFKRAGLIRIKKHALEIVDADRLRQLVS